MVKPSTQTMHLNALESTLDLGIYLLPLSSKITGLVLMIHVMLLKEMFIVTFTVKLLITVLNSLVVPLPNAMLLILVLDTTQHSSIGFVLMLLVDLLDIPLHQTKTLFVMVFQLLLQSLLHLFLYQCQFQLLSLLPLMSQSLHLYQLL